MKHAAPLKVSFCTTCMGRLDHLKQTLPQNLANNPGENVEFVILAYGDRETYDWVKDNFSDQIASGKIKLAFSEQKFFRMAHAKNMAHRLGTGDILCNLDADNITGKGFANWLSRQFKQHPDSFVRSAIHEHLIRKLSNQHKPGISGRIAVSCDTFKQTYGYDEYFSGWGNDDVNFESRCVLTGSRRVHLPINQYGDVIRHSNKIRLNNYSDSDKEVAEENLSRPRNYVSAAKRLLCISEHHHLTQGANPGGNFGCGDVTVLTPDGHEEQITLSPTPETPQRDVKTQMRGRR